MVRCFCLYMGRPLAFIRKITWKQYKVWFCDICIFYMFFKEDNIRKVIRDKYATADVLTIFVRTMHFLQ